MALWTTSMEKEMRGLLVGDKYQDVLVLWYKIKLLASMWSSTLKEFKDIHKLHIFELGESIVIWFHYSTLVDDFSSSYFSVNFLL